MSAGLNSAFSQAGSSQLTGTSGSVSESVEDGMSKHKSVHLTDGGLKQLSLRFFNDLVFVSVFCLPVVSS